MICTIDEEKPNVIKCDKGGGMVTYIENTQENRVRLGLVKQKAENVLWEASEETPKLAKMVEEPE